MADTATPQEKNSGRILSGMKEICAYVGKSENTVIKYIKSEGFPAAKIGGEWISDEGRIDDWRLGRIGKINN
jgi:predicted DNA-binding transcriptional regulator AlpA